MTADRRLAAALDQLAEAVTVHDLQGRMLYANAAAVRLLGYESADELLAAPPGSIMARYRVLHPDARPVAPEELPGRRAMKGAEPEPLLVRWFGPGSPELRWSLIKARPLRDEDGAIVGAVNIMEDVTEVKEAELTQRILGDVAQALAASTDYQEALRAITAVVVPELCDSCGVDLRGPRGELWPIAAGHPAAGAAGQLQEVITAAETVLVQDLDDPSGVRSVLVTPLVGTGGPLGALTFVITTPGRRFTQTDVALGQELGRRAGIVVEKARFEQERGRIADVLQAGLRPPQLPEMPGWRTATLFRAAGMANQVGGDFYDAQRCDGGWLVTVGDVAGKGATAAAVTPRVRHSLNSAVTLTGDLAAGLRHVNGVLLAATPPSLCSVAAALLEVGGRARLASAGHPPPVLADSAGARFVGGGATLLGAVAVSDWPLHELTLGHGDVLVLYTDGVTDAVGAGERFGHERLLAVVAEAAENGAAAVVDAIAAALDEFQSGPQRDDIAVLAVQRDASRASAAWTADALPAEVGPLRSAVVAFAASAGIPESRLYDVRLAVSEALTNVVVHAYREDVGPGLIHVEARCDGDEVEVVVMDDGLGLSPRLDSPGLGLGIPMIAAMSDSHRFSGRRAGRGTRLCMRFDLRGEPVV